jgi:lipoprotein-releasing system ATP-binding protein
MNSPGATAEPLLRCSKLGRYFREGAGKLKVLDELEFAVRPAELIAIVGASGSGKTTLLQLLGGLDTPTSGTVSIAGQDLATLSGNARGSLRNRHVGFVYQFHHLLPEFSALENVAMPLLLRRLKLKDVHEESVRLLERVGLADRMDHKPGELSGGERQRAAVARALVTRPDLVLADEPTGNLDAEIGNRVFDLMLELNREAGSALVVVTHDMRIAARMDRVMELRGGRLHDVSADHTG